MARLFAVFGIAVGGGLAFVLVTNVVVGAFRGPPSQFFTPWGVAALFILAISIPITAFQVLFGVAGVAIGWLLFLVIGNPASGGSSAPQLLPGFWRWVSQGLPPGAASSSVRDIVYFNAHGSGGTLLVLAGYSIVGAALALVLYARQARRLTARPPA